jgi:acetylornithine deacetylase
VAGAVAAWAAERLLDVDVREGTPGRPSVLVRARGGGGGRTLLLCAHTDTVGVPGMEAPHQPGIEGDRLYGRGAYDAALVEWVSIPDTVTCTRTLIAVAQRFCA